jgi:hypothetical protein
MIGRARKYAAISENLSDQQRAVADQATAVGIEKNKEKLMGSHWMKAMQQDVDMFGDEAFKIGWPRLGLNTLIIRRPRAQRVIAAVLVQIANLKRRDLGAAKTDL